jgi:hypothetical protein
MNADAKQRLITATRWALAIHAVIWLWVAGHNQPAPKTIATARRESVRHSPPQASVMGAALK